MAISSQESKDTLNKTPQRLIVISFPSVFFIMVCFLLLPLVGFYLGMQYENRVAIKQLVPKQQQNLPEDKKANTSSDFSVKCSKYGNEQYSQFLTPYTIQKGDTLLSIANTQLGSTSRINEIVNINASQYPMLKDQNPFLEVGWILYLPPQNMVTSGKNLRVLNGEVDSMGPAYFGVNANNEHDSFPYGPAKDLLAKAGIKLGDCVSVWSDDINGVLSVELQKKK